jgi:hypothetical protein
MTLSRSLRYGGGMVARHTLAVMARQDYSLMAANYPALAAFRPERWFSLQPDTARSVVESEARRTAVMTRQDLAEYLGAEP